jgi:hypothetical protein
MQAYGVAPRASGGPILGDIAALAGREDAQAETGQFVIPDDVVLAPYLSGVDDPLRELIY